ncbi:MAG: hypothetical protein LUQ07_05380 [Methanospirillum sp.]|nr:hypothetical protein [Methanospirillum sp.]
MSSVRKSRNPEGFHPLFAIADIRPVIRSRRLVASLIRFPGSALSGDLPLCPCSCRRESHYHLCKPWPE